MRLPSPPGATSSWRCRRQGRRWVQADTRCSWRVPSASLFQLRIQHRGFIWACTGLSTVAGPPNATLHDHSTCRLHIPLPAACPLSCHAEHRCAGGGVARRPHPAPAPRRHRRRAAAQLCGVVCVHAGAGKAVHQLLWRILLHIVCWPHGAQRRWLALPRSAAGGSLRSSGRAVCLPANSPSCLCLIYFSCLLTAPSRVCFLQALSFGTTA